MTMLLSFPQFVTKYQELRKAQNEYFKAKRQLGNTPETAQLLATSKMLEKQLDEEANKFQPQTPNSI